MIFEISIKYINRCQSSTTFTTYIIINPTNYIFNLFIHLRDLLFQQNPKTLQRLQINSFVLLCQYMNWNRFEIYLMSTPKKKKNMISFRIPRSQVNIIVYAPTLSARSREVSNEMLTTQTKPFL